MRIEFQPKRVAIDSSLRGHIESRIAAAIGRFEEFIDCVVVQLANGSRTGDAATHQCVIRVNLVPPGDIEVEDRDRDPYILATRAAARANLALMAELWRRRDSVKARRTGR